MGHSAGATIALAAMLLAAGCQESVPASPQQEAQRWVALVPVGTPADKAYHQLEANGFLPFFANGILYGFRSKEWCIGHSDGVVLRIAMDSAGHAELAQAYDAGIDPRNQPLPDIQH